MGAGRVGVQARHRERAASANGFDPDEKVCYHGGVRSVMESNLADSKSDGNCETLGYGVAHSNNAILGKLAYQKLEPTLLDRTARDLGWANSLPDVARREGDVRRARAAAATRISSSRKPPPGFTGSRLSVLGGALLSRDVCRRRRAAGAAPHRIDRRQAVHVAEAASACSPRTSRRPSRKMMRRDLRVGQRGEELPQASNDRGRRQDRHADDEQAVLHGALVVRRVCARRQARRSWCRCFSATPKAGTCAATKRPSA